MGEMIKARRILLFSIVFLFFFSQAFLLCSAEGEHGSRNLAVVMKKRVKYRGPRNTTTSSAASTIMFPGSFHIGAASSLLLALLL
ncbi:hypothetical protein AtNW77_Chr4g0305951 [Arabidopsis thaliana]|jgi:hypothetical protein|uniref:Transmembrane protein n=4 Tax=Arabidopsis TaxID=3701 RepID=Q94AQ4_ARATH|nr:uncharacterized protein AT4G28085 [Arabidopsis thaliana]NP_567796.1 uncharacterized protein AT4G28085 [Arabidopsis thaliana]KAG7617623.1 hypothetical protein ISN45_At04g029670 [Arabidopsis thaliana x Arabidopsis arenosa]KAG7622081.1 hypothetical protein ISN44_As04g029120 [Arabidopsis suecica]AAK76551.1 unknown protein [Arabidopsis thaliana]AAM45130.1 unknown protein [Arabidopsis thaliana]AEE85437.1 transmembrane protein [Arabidopsis thaliana]|eukprot:NP_001031738.1 transmembrane protein [Arabidopsis thaliana]